jgi:hypothetical protein
MTAQRAPPALPELLVRLLGTACPVVARDGGRAAVARPLEHEARLARPPKDLDADLAEPRFERPRSTRGEES